MAEQMRVAIGQCRELSEDLLPFVNQLGASGVHLNSAAHPWRRALGSFRPALAA